MSELAEWDIDLLGEELDVIFDIDMSDFGFDMTEEQETQTEREDLSDKVGETYEVIVECVNEIEQEQIYNKLIGDGYSCRVLTL